MRAGRPQLGQQVTFEVELHRDGRKRAKNVAPVRTARTKGRRAESPAQWGTASLFAIPAFLAIYLAVQIAWRVPLWVAAGYAMASVVSFLFYAFDKSAATAGRRRVPESTLLWIGLLGGWPGSIIAQQALRHKSSKASFRSAFWGTVVLNVAGFIALNSPLASAIGA